MFCGQMSKLQRLLDVQCPASELASQDLIDGLESGYMKLARKKEVSHRISSYLYFSRNIYRYSLPIIVQSILRSVQRRTGTT